MHNRFFLVFLIFFQQSLAQKEINIIPQPTSIEWKKGQFIIDSNTIVYASKESAKTVEIFKNYLQINYGISIKYIPVSYNRIDHIYPSGAICFLTYLEREQNKESYMLSILQNNILIEGDAAGKFYAIQSLLQLLPAKAYNNQISIPAVKIIDQPRFSYRGMHLDVARHFFDVPYVKKYIDFLAMHKLNSFHWHLTDDQGWRIEIKKYPLLTQIGSCRNQTLVGPYGSNKYDGKKYCGYYTQEEIKEIVAYAADRFISVIPEIEMPGHAVAALTSYPNLGCKKGPYKVMETWGVSEEVFCAGNDSTYTFLEDVLDEVTTLFPSTYIHIGGDECPKKSWQLCTACQNKIKKEGLKDEMGLQSFFVSKMEKHLNLKGKRIIGWDEILEGGLAPNATVMSWRGEEGGIAAAREKHDAIMTPGKPVYFDHSQSISEDSITQGGLNSLQDVYEYEPIPVALEKSLHHHIIGAQANLWTEYINNTTKLEYQLFPRLSALSEVLWTIPENKNWKRFEKNIPDLFKKYEALGINFSKAYFDIQTKPVVRYYEKSGRKEYPVGISWQLNARDTTHKLFISRPYFEAENTYPSSIEIPVIQDGTYTVTLQDKAGQNISNPIKQHFSINKATGKNLAIKTMPSNKYSVGGILTLVDGIKNNAGMSKSAQFLGFEGTDLDVTIDLNAPTTINSIILNTFNQPESWIYSPSEVTFWVAENGKNILLTDSITKTNHQNHIKYHLNMKSPGKYRYVRILAKNAGVIQDPNPGAGNRAWLFVDEIEIY